MRESLPEVGGTVDQIAWIMAAFGLLESEFYSCQQYKKDHRMSTHEEVVKKFDG